MEFNATFLVSIISFIVFTKIMNAIFYIPLTSVIEERENIVRENFKQTHIFNEKAEVLLQDKENKLASTAKQTRQILIDKTKEANSNYKTQVNEAKTKSGIKINELKSELIQSENNAKQVLDTQIDDLAQVIINKALQGGLNG